MKGFLWKINQEFPYARTIAKTKLQPTGPPLGRSQISVRVAESITKPIVIKLIFCKLVFKSL